MGKRHSMRCFDVFFYFYFISFVFAAIYLSVCTVYVVLFAHFHVSV